MSYVIQFRRFIDGDPTPTAFCRRCRRVAKVVKEREPIGFRRGGGRRLRMDIPHFIARCHTCSAQRVLGEAPLKGEQSF